MAKKQLGEALVGLDGSAPGSIDEVFRETERILRRSGQWSRCQAVLIGVFLLTSLGAVFLFFYFYWAKVHPGWEKINEEIEAFEGFPVDESNVDQGTQLAMYAPWRTDRLFVAGVFGAFWFSLSVVALMLAGLISVWLILCSRRATVRHVNACLVEISGQLKRLEASLGKAPGDT